MADVLLACAELEDFAEKSGVGQAHGSELDFGKLVEVCGGDAAVEEHVGVAAQAVCVEEPAQLQVFRAACHFLMAFVFDCIFLL